jgi:hypothetical protein
MTLHTFMLSLIDFGPGYWILLMVYLTLLYIISILPLDSDDEHCNALTYHTVGVYALVFMAGVIPVLQIGVTVIAFLFVMTHLPKTPIWNK